MPGEQSESVAVINKAMNQYNLLQLRLDTSEIINQARMYLNAEIEMVKQDELGNLARDVISVGVPKANKKGIASILNWLQMTLNPQVVQGNFPLTKGGISEMYNGYIYEFQIDLMDMLMINLYAYDIEEDEVQSIVDAMMNIVKPFMTRLIGNRERESYGETFKEVSNTNIRDNSKTPLTN